MKKLILSLFAALLLTVSTAQAQTLLDNTTLSAAVGLTDTVITVGSVTCTGCTFGYDTLIYVDLEAMRVARNYVSGTTIPVRRGTDGTRPARHKNAAVTILGPPARFYNLDPAFGACGPRSSQQYLPWVNIVTGRVWTCDGNPNVWRSTVPYATNNDTPSRTLSKVWTPESAIASRGTETPSASVWDRLWASTVASLSRANAFMSQKAFRW